jgi:tRNA(Ile)-lysidine synthase
MSDTRQLDVTAAAPVDAGERDRALAGLSDFDAVVLAVSGGPDSMALLHLVAGWKTENRFDRPVVHVATVDHRLRPQSAGEARAVAEASVALGFTHTTLTWSDGRSDASGLQEAARNARYRLLTEYASRLGAVRVAVVTAHTADDQAETLLMRLARGSGLDGMAAMAAQRSLDGAADVMLVRPLLGFGKDRLMATLAAAGRTWIDDPSNENTRFERVRLRAAGKVLAGLGFDNGRLALSDFTRAWTGRRSIASPRRSASGFSQWSRLCSGARHQRPSCPRSSS